ncbi:hypothetical protein PCASD_23279 [Puccinia coronata f. sp. avenae]|uniref:Uncharacterized protein n=1 Tax=Puccinia coronata f. sp. avenae TaxID=200324 RepID=A0A2N5RYS9_9BASI|nr:hypothetical protein PCASD_23279 [Puccinia coronata f. sp. avenae]
MPPRAHAALLQATAPILNGLSLLVQHLDDYVRGPFTSFGINQQTRSPILWTTLSGSCTNYFDLQQGAMRAFSHDFATSSTCGTTPSVILSIACMPPTKGLNSNSQQEYTGILKSTIQSSCSS